MEATGEWTASRPVRTRLFQHGGSLKIEGEGDFEAKCIGSLPEFYLAGSPLACGARVATFSAGPACEPLTALQASSEFGSALTQIINHRPLSLLRAL